MSISCLYLLPVFLKSYSKLLSNLPPLPFTVLAEPPAPKFHLLALLIYPSYICIRHCSLLYLLLFLLFALLSAMFWVFTRILATMCCPSPDWKEIACCKMLAFVVLRENKSNKTLRHTNSYVPTDMLSFPNTLEYSNRLLRIIILFIVAMFILWITDKISLLKTRRNKGQWKYNSTHPLIHKLDTSKRWMFYGG